MAFLPVADGSRHEAGRFCERQMAADANREASANGRLSPTQCRKQNQIAECPVMTGFPVIFASEMLIQRGFNFSKV